MGGLFSDQQKLRSDLWTRRRGGAGQDFL